jgi:hypothetical protein
VGTIGRRVDRCQKFDAYERGALAVLTGGDTAAAFQALERRLTPLCGVGVGETGPRSILRAKSDPHRLRERDLVEIVTAGRRRGPYQSNRGGPFMTAGVQASNSSEAKRIRRRFGANNDELERKQKRQKPEDFCRFSGWPRMNAAYELAPREGFEPPTERLTAASSTTELPGINARLRPAERPAVSAAGRSYIRAKFLAPVARSRGARRCTRICPASQCSARISASAD